MVKNNRDKLFSMINKTIINTNYIFILDALYENVFEVIRNKDKSVYDMNGIIITKDGSNVKISCNYSEEKEELILNSNEYISMIYYMLKYTYKELNDIDSLRKIVSLDTMIDYNNIFFLKDDISDKYNRKIYVLYMLLLLKYLNVKYKLYEYDQLFYSSNMDFLCNEHDSLENIFQAEYDFIELESDFYIENLTDEEINTIKNLSFKTDDESIKNIISFIDNTLPRVLSITGEKSLPLNIVINYALPFGEFISSPDEQERRKYAISVSDEIEKNISDIDLRCGVANGVKLISNKKRK